MEPKVIMLADDDADDTALFREALALADQTIICHCALNGSEALKLLNRLDPKPQIIFLDLNMPGMSGWECLMHLKADERYKHIPVIMMSTSSHKPDIETAKKLGARCYFVKPNNFNDLKHILSELATQLGGNLTSAITGLKNTGYKQIFSCSEND